MDEGLNQIAFFRTYAEIFKSLNAELAKELLDGIIDYAFYDIEPKFENILIKTTFLGMKNGIDNSKKRAGNYNAKKTDENNTNLVVERKNESFPKKKPVVLQKKTSPLLEKKKEKEKQEEEAEGEKDIHSRASSTTSVNGSSVCKEIIDFLNVKANTNYKYSTKKTQEKINARFNEGYTLDDFKIVINKKVDEWKNTEMERFLRPETLFGNKFESYLNQKIVDKSRVISKNQHEQRQFENIENLYD